MCELFQLKGKKKKKKPLKPSGIAWENREFESYPPFSCLSDFLPSCFPFHTVYKYWQNLPASVKVSLHLISFWPHYFALWFLFPLLDFVIILCDYNYLVWLWFLSIVLWCLLPLSTSISWLYNMNWVLESKQIVFLVFQFPAIIFLHNCVYHGLWFRLGLIFMVLILSHYASVFILS